MIGVCRTICVVRQSRQDKVRPVFCIDKNKQAGEEIERKGVSRGVKWGRARLRGNRRGWIAMGQPRRRRRHGYGDGEVMRLAYV